MVKKDLIIGDIFAKEGEIKTGYLNGVHLDFHDYDIPIILMNGKHEGPILSLTAVVHGTEISGIEMIRRVIYEEIDISNLHGGIIAVPVCNPVAFAWHEHKTPQDGINMSMVFPGDKNGNLTQKLANIVWTNAVTKSQYNIDIHHDGWPAIPYILSKIEIAKDKETARISNEMAKSTGLTILHQGSRPFWGKTAWGSLTDATMKYGIPSVTVEVNAPMSSIVNECVDVGIISILNVMKYLKMIPSKPEKQPENMFYMPGEFQFRPEKFPKTKTGGYLVEERVPGEFIKEGETIAKIYNIFGEKMEEIKMQVDGYLWAYRAFGSLVHEGSNVGNVFTKYQKKENSPLF